MTGSNGFKLSMSEFKGKVCESLDNIDHQFELNRQQHELFFNRIRGLEMKPSFSMNPGRWLMALLGFKKI